MSDGNLAGPWVIFSCQGTFTPKPTEVDVILKFKFNEEKVKQRRSKHLDDDQLCAGLCGGVLACAASACTGKAACLRADKKSLAAQKTTHARGKSSLLKGLSKTSAVGRIHIPRTGKTHCEGESDPGQ